MKRTYSLLAFTCASVVAHGQYFHSDFDEANLAAITGLNIDTPSTSGADSGTVSLDTVDDQLDLTANKANMWGAREGAPIAWVASPTVAVGETWFVETQVNMTNATGGAATYKQSGIIFYDGPDGANPGAIDPFVLFLNDWNNWNVQNAILSVGSPANSAGLTSTDTNIFLRVEITEGGATDTYNFFYKEDVGDPWTQLGGAGIDRAGSFANSRVGLTIKSHNNNANGAAQFDYLTVDIIQTWETDGSSDWSTPANWATAAPNAVSAEAIFSDSLPYTDPLTASLDVAVTLGALALESAEAITIDGANALTFDDGSAASVSATAGSHLISAPVSLADPLYVRLDSGSALDISGALTGTTSLTNSGAGSLTLSGDLSGHSGSIISEAGSLVVSGTNASDITVNGGILELSGTGSNITVNSGATLGGEGSVAGTLTLAANSSLSVDPTNGTTAFTANTLSPTAPANVEFTSNPFGLGTFTVLNYTTYSGTVATDFVSSDYRVSFADTTTSITATPAAAETSNWTGSDGSNPTFWDIGTSLNWSSSDSLFFNEDAVTFTDTGVGAVDIQAAVAPGTITLTNTVGNNYTFEDLTANVQTISAETGGINITGDGDVTLNVKITGHTDITHSGTGTLSLGGGLVNNDFVGTITVDEGGTLRNLRNIDNVNSLGDFSNTFSFSNGSKFDLNSISTHRDYQEYGTGSFVFGDGTTITNSGTTSGDCFGDQLVFEGDITLDGDGRFDIHDTIDVTGTDIVITVTGEVGNVIAGDNSAQSIAEWVVDNGQLIAANDNALGNAAFVTVNPGGALRANIVGGAAVRTVANNVTLNGGQIEAGYQGDSNAHYTGTITVAADSIIVPNDDDDDYRELHLSGTLTGSSNVSIGSGRTVFASSLNTAGFTGDIILEKNNPSRALELSLENGINVTQDIIVADVGTIKNIVLTAGNSAEISGNITVNDTTPEDFDFDVVDAGDTLTVSGDISGAGAAGVTKTSAGSLTLSGQNTYSGNSVIWNGTVTLADGGSQAFYPTTNGTSNKVTPSGANVATLNADGEIYFDLNGADTTAGNVWPIIEGGATLIVNVGATFSVNSSLGTFTEDADVWTLIDGAYEWTFTESTGTLELGLTPFGEWADAEGATLDPDADDDSDDLENILEFAFGTDPNVSDASPLYLGVDSFDPGTPIVDVLYGPFSVKARFIRLVDHSTSGISYTAQFTSKLTDPWEDVAGDTATIIPGIGASGGYEAVELDYPLFLSTGKKAQFFRLRVDSVNSEEVEPE